MIKEFELAARPYRLRNRVQHYAWGTRNEAAFIPRLLGEAVEPGRPYAELWIGAHPKAPSQVLSDADAVPLGALIAAEPEAWLGEAVAHQFGAELPFLLKVLSAAEALSIQAHPTQEQAARLHERDPEHYPDANHKPEVAVALDGLTALVGFKPWAELRAVVSAYPEIAEFGGAMELADETALHEFYARLLRRALAEPEALEAATARLAHRLTERQAPLSETERLFLQLRVKYGGADVGLCSLFLFNLLHLQPGAGVYTEAGVPHAYLRGNIIECMANSDNVVRAGLTPKFKDVETLVEILTPQMGPAPVSTGEREAGWIIYRTPAAEFELSRRELAVGERVEIATGGRIEIYLVTRGSVRLHWADETAAYGRGASFVVPALLERFGLAAEDAAEIFRVRVPGRRL
ncbi:MAG TPA: mannose-6-phosphate isomerase, class I [Thermoflexia bacterium]|nr:mannose-6-phosphate isomerase, class I [Thermoflexia bacterium]